MKISLNALKRFISIPCTAQELEAIFPLLGLEVESVEFKGLQPMEHIVVGEILKKDKHPEADRLTVCQVQVSLTEEPIQIVCGATNHNAGDRVSVALVGATLPGDFKIKKSKLRGVESCGMMCSSRELGLGEDSQGLLILANRPEIGTPINAVFTDSDVVFDLKITANRGDCLSYLGIAQELSARFGQPINFPVIKTKLPVTNKPTADNLLKNITLDTPNCPYYTAISIEGLTIAPSPEWLQKELTAIGLRPVNNVVDITNFVMFETGQPLHAFDAGKIANKELIIRQAKPGEKITTLDQKERELEASILVIADAEKALVVAGVMGSLVAEVDDNTNSIILEAAYFNHEATRKTARKLGLSTDSSYRFSRKVDSQGTLKASFRAVDLILELCGGSVKGPVCVLGEPINQAHKIQISPDFIRKKCGFEVSDEIILTTFKNLGFIVEQKSTQGWDVQVPSVRQEVRRPIDLVEEFLRIYGTLNIPTASPRFTGLAREDAAIDIFTQKARNYLTARGFDECCHYVIRSEKDLLASSTVEETKALALDNPLTHEHTHLRSNLVTCLCESLRHNQDHRNVADRLFEIGNVFQLRNNEAWELLSVAFVIRLKTTERTWQPAEACDFYDLKRLVLDLAELANVKSLALEPLTESILWQAEHAASSSQKIALLKQGFEATLGPVHVNILKAWKLDSPVLAGEITFLPTFFDRKKKAVRYDAYSAFPASAKDIALIVDASLAAENVLSSIEKIAQKATQGKFAVETCTLFDVYQGKGIPEGKKSLAFTLSYRAMDRTLTDQELTNAFDLLVQGIKTETSFLVREN